ncbi:MAG: polyprenyl diphosphate synthase [bacterium]
MIETEKTSKSPVHLGLILDGNRRWAKNNHLTTMEGHKAGYLNLKKIIKIAKKHNIQYISAFVFSNENWKRGNNEVKNLMKLFSWILKHEVKEISKEGIRLRVIGSKLRIGKALVKAIHDAEEVTKDNTKGTLLLCLDYGGQQEIVEATKRIVESGVSPKDITADLISQNLDMPGIPPLDLIIRTSGEHRLSNFMLWESAYSELFFVNKLWPDFSEANFESILKKYSKIKRNFGK